MPPEDAIPHPEALPRPAANPNAWTTFWRTVASFQRDKLNPTLAARNTVGVTLPIIVGAALGFTPAGLAMATGALNVCFTDGQQPYRQRAQRMFAACFLVAAAVSLGALCGHNESVSILAAAVWACAAGMLVSLGGAATDVGNISLVTLIVYMAVPQSFERAVYAGLLAFAGGVFQTLLSLAFWPLRPYLFERRALASLCYELARAAGSAVQVYQSPPATAEMTQAQTALAPLITDHSIDAERYRLLLSQAERMRLSVLALRRLRARLQRERRPEAALIDAYLVKGADILREIADALEAARNTTVDRDAFSDFRALCGELRHADAAASGLVAATLRDARSQMDALTGQLRAAFELATSSTVEGFREFQRGEMSRPARLRLGAPLATLRANLNLQSSAFRHAVRLAVCVAVGEALAHALNLRRPYWLPMTIAIVLRPDFTATFSRGVLRIAGTVVGLVLTTAMFHILPLGPHLEIALIAAGMFLMRYAGPANYGVFAIAVTALVVALIAMTGVDPRPVIAARGLNTAFGGVIALLAYWLWPTWERKQAPEAIAAMLDAYRDYFRAIRLSYEQPGESFDSLRDRARLAARLARSNVEASIERVCAEPGASREVMHVLSGILASSHRMVHAFMALEAGLDSSGPVPAREPFRTFANHIELTLYSLAAALRGSPLHRKQLPDLREDHNALVTAGDPGVERYALVNIETDRMTNSLNTLAAEILTWLH